ncbi:TlpA family protein disulfide reductase [Mucilaginibacter myungsuensis]|uniref:TlpA family protein disulfide reductase n=1 Tax=Mucilaginibacter myungsuensis TaxID=649104 RepID=A0A929L127_9SPHI|nr:TlpA disulfide reductase family protein [Mucilaginibacter myungsuensis]MBE9663638.1 TlpA family protein disulfide reductase [Mucilaginibacter myungsuensis]MDN3599038.1 TlpA disulfide reductase family protein [Mucilaginibacter myungsuensis]
MLKITYSFINAKLLAVAIPIALFSILDASAQALHPDAVNSRTKFFDNYHKDPDTALFYARKLAKKSEDASYLRQAVHSDIFYYFTDVFRQKVADQAKKDNKADWKKDLDKGLLPMYNTIYKMSTDADPIVSGTAKPIYLWTNVNRLKMQMAEADEVSKLGGTAVKGGVKDKLNLALGSPVADKAKIKALAQSFIAMEATQKDLFQDKTGTYALLMYKDIADDKDLSKQADELLALTMKATLPVINSIDDRTASREAFAKRAWTRYIYAAANYFKAERLVKAGDPKAAMSYYQAAAKYSPDFYDMGIGGEYGNEEMLFGNNDKQTFNKAYVDHLKKYGTKDETLAALTEMALRNPVDRKTDLSTFYAANFAGQETFAAYWRKAVNEGRPVAPEISVTKTDGVQYSSTKQKGKWILVDFWGSWCGPCREEHPALQKIYTKAAADASGKLDIITIACYDTREKVDAYMKEFKYSYPVAMNDNKLNKTYNVQGFPTKFLITPEGNYFPVPFNYDLVGFIERYTED